MFLLVSFKHEKAQSFFRIWNLRRGGGTCDASQAMGELGGLWEKLRRLAALGSPGLLGGLKSNYCGTSQLKRKRSFQMPILRKAFEGKCHQVM